MWASELVVGDIVVDFQVDDEDQPTAVMLKVLDVEKHPAGIRVLFENSDYGFDWADEPDLQVFRNGEWL